MAAARRRLTNGAAGEIRHRVCAARSRRRMDRSHAAGVRLAIRIAIEEVRLREHCARAPSPAVTALVLLDKRVDRLAKAKRADRYVYASPGLRRFAGLLHQRSRAERCHADHRRPIRSCATTRGAARSSIDYKSKQGVPLQATLLYPAGYEPGASTRWSSTCTRSSRTACISSRALRTRLLQRRGVHRPRLLLSAARHRVPAARSGSVGDRVRSNRRCSG